MGCSWGALLPRVPTITHPVQYMWSQRQFTLSLATTAIGLAVNLIGMTTGAFGGGPVSGFVIKLHY